MIVWINGTFGVGKTTTAGLLAERTDWRVFDPEHVGYLLQSNMADVPVEDFQDLGPWRTLVPMVADEIFLATSNPAMIAVQTVLDEAINPALASHGGYATLVNIEESTVFVTMGGGCQGCAASAMTLRDGIRSMLMNAIPEISEVVDATDHTAGENPFYT